MITWLKIAINNDKIIERKAGEIYYHHAPARSGKRYTAWCGKIDTVAKWSENKAMTRSGKQDISYQPPVNLLISPSTVINQALRAIKLT